MAQAQVDVRRLLERVGVSGRVDGSEMWAPCLSHAERKPSWSVNLRTGAHHCFGCGWGGGPADLVLRALDADSLGWTVGDAWDWIRENGLLIDDIDPRWAVEVVLVAGERGGVRLPVGVRFEPVERWPSPARAYMRQRGIEDWQIERWRLGFATIGRLEGRIVFPVRDATGRLGTYSARSFVGAEPRYLTPKIEDRPDPAALFGEERWPSGDRRRLIVVEGAIKALAVERAIADSLRFSVAGILGAARAGDARLCAKVATFAEVVLLLDNDAAGAAATEALAGALVRHVKLRRARLDGPAVDDAESEAIRTAIEGAK